MIKIFILNYFNPNQCIVSREGSDQKLMDAISEIKLLKIRMNNEVMKNKDLRDALDTAIDALEKQNINNKINK